MTDFTAPLTELRAAYRAYQSAKKAKRDEIMERHKARMEDEIQATMEAEKHAFAKLLKDRKEFYGLRVTDIQDHVLRTRNWKVWEELRDYAEIQPEQITRENAREEKARESAIFFWNADGDLVVQRASDGTPIEPVTFLWSTVRERNGRYIIDAADFADESRILRHDVPLRKIVEDAVRARVAEVGLDNQAEKP